jgi:putative holliday junction resolvase
MQDLETTNTLKISNVSLIPDEGRILSLDLGTKKVGFAVCDETQTAIRPFSVVQRTNWKDFLKKTIAIIDELDAKVIVIGLPYNMDGTESSFAPEVKRIHRNFSLSLKIPAFLQDERLTTLYAERHLKEQGFSLKEMLKRVDSEAAAIILRDFLELKTQLKTEEANMNIANNI